MACDVCGPVLVWPRAFQQTAAGWGMAPTHPQSASEGDNDPRSPLSGQSRGPQRRDKRARKQKDARSNVTSCSTRPGNQPLMIWQI